jgi:hypothetical protein
LVERNDAHAGCAEGEADCVIIKKSNVMRNTADIKYFAKEMSKEMVFQKAHTGNSSIIFYGVLFAVAFGLSWIWEIGQMFAYTTDAGNSWAKSFVFCTLAASADAVVTVLISSFLRSLMKPAGVKIYFSAAVSGAMCAIVFELVALRFGLWAYSERMIVLPFIGAGLLPFIQLTLLVPLAIWLTVKFRGV